MTERDVFRKSMEAQSPVHRNHMLCTVRQCPDRAEMSKVESRPPYPRVAGKEGMGTVVVAAS